MKFYASLGNHDAREQRYYKLFNMDGKLYYTFSPKPERPLLRAREHLSGAGADSSGWRTSSRLRAATGRSCSSIIRCTRRATGTAPTCACATCSSRCSIKYNVSVVLTGHDHFYERVKPQKGITYFVVGSGGQLRKGNIDQRSGITAKGFDTDLAFMAAEIAGDEMYFQAIARDGQTVDSGVVKRRTDAR